MNDSTMQSETLASPPESAPSGGSDAAAAAIDHDRFFFVRLVDALLVLTRRGLSSGLVMLSSRWLALIGMWAMIAFAGLVTLWGLIAAIQMDSIDIFGTGLAIALVGLVLLYTASKFCTAGAKIIDATPSELGSTSFLDSVALLAAVLALVSLIGGIVAGIREEAMLPVGAGFGFAAGWAYLAAMALNSSLVNVAVRSGGSAGQEFLGIVSFLLKALLRIAPIAFGVIAAIGTLLFAIDIIRYLAAEEWDRILLIAQLMELATLILFAAALPFLVYIVVAAVYLLFDLARSILRIA